MILSKIFVHSRLPMKMSVQLKDCSFYRRFLFRVESRSESPHTRKFPTAVEDRRWAFRSSENSESLPACKRRNSSWVLNHTPIRWRLKQASDQLFWPRFEEVHPGGLEPPTLGSEVRITRVSQPIRTLTSCSHKLFWRRHLNAVEVGGDSRSLGRHRN